MAKRLSVQDKKEIIEFFTAGKTIDELSKEFNCSKLTISRNLKKDLGEKKYKELTPQIKNTEKAINFSENKFSDDLNNKDFSKKYKNKIDNHKNEELIKSENDFSTMTTFTEIAPLDIEIDNSTQKDLSSVPLSDMVFPKIVYIVVDSKIELEIKYLRDYPEWEFLSNDELNRKTIQIYFDLKIAKRSCNKEQKVIKVPNTDVFKIVAPILLSKGISRIVSSDILIAL